MRWLTLSGVAFIALFGGAAAAYGSGAGSSRGEILAYYSSSADRTRQLVGFALLLLGVIFLVLFVVALRMTIVRDVLFGTIVVSSGVAAATLLTVANGLWAGTALTAHLEGAAHISPATHLMLEDTGFGFFLAAAAMSIPLVAATALGAHRSQSAASWFGWLSALAVGGLATAFWYVPTALFGIWVLAASGLALRGT